MIVAAGKILILFDYHKFEIEYPIISYELWVLLLRYYCKNSQSRRFVIQNYILMNEKLLPKMNFDQVYNKASQMMTQLKQMNDEAQAMDDSQFEELRERLKEMRNEFKECVIDSSGLIAQLEKQAVGSDQKRKTKLIKDEQKKQIDRNKVIQEQLVEQGFRFKRQSQIKQSSNIRGPEDSQMVYQEEFLVSVDQIEVDNLLIKERDEEINDIYQNAQQLQKVVNELAVVVDKADIGLDMVITNQQDTKNNLIGAQKELTGAEIEQKKTQRKLIWILIIALIIAAACGVGLYFAIR